jgi:hypothetical protein
MLNIKLLYKNGCSKRLFGRRKIKISGVIAKD